jgi:hypothetical protein
MDEERESELLRKLEESKKWDKFYYGLMVAGVMIAIVGVYLEFSGILKEGGLAIAILGAGLSFIGGFINTARILSRIDFKSTLICDAVRDEGKKTRKEERETREVLGKSLGEMGKLLAEIRDLLKRGDDSMKDAFSKKRIKEEKENGIYVLYGDGCT